MKRKHWGIVVAVGLGEMLLSSALMLPGAPRQPMQFLVLGGTAVFLAGLLGLAAHPAWVCPHCGKGIGGRGLRTPRGPLARGGETFVCPHCGVMLHSHDLKKAE